MRTRQVLLIATGVFASLSGVSAARSPRTTPPPPICDIDSLRLANTFHQIEVALDPNATDAEHIAYIRDTLGLAGVLPSHAVRSVDSAKCAAARTSYLLSKEPTDLIRREQLAAMVPGVILVQLSPNRYLMNSGVYHTWTINEFWLFDSTFTTVPGLFY